jgi:hypothetical protein
MSSRTVMVVAALGLTLLACRRAQPLPSTDQPLAVLERPTLLGGGHLQAAPLAGKVVLVNFWSPT